MGRIFTYFLQRRYFAAWLYCICLLCTSQFFFGQSPERTQGCGYSYSLSQKEVCLGDSCILSTNWGCVFNAPYYDFEVFDGIIATEILHHSHGIRYALSFAGPGNVTFRFDHQFHAITVHDPLQEAKPLAHSIFCKDDQPLELDTSASAYWLNAAPVTSIDPSALAVGSYTLTEQCYKDEHGCRFKKDSQITIAEACSPPTATAGVVYPNPSKDYLMVPADAETNIRFLDVYGKVVVERKADGLTTKVNVEELPAGIFIVEFLDNEKPQKVKIVHL